MEILDGKMVSQKLKDKVKDEVSNHFVTPVLAVVSIGNDEASKIYVENKRKACEYTGMSMLHLHFSEKETEKKVIFQIKKLNKDKNVNGIIVQLPLPKGFDEDKIINTIDSSKDVDCLTYANMGKLMSDKALFKPCTPSGIIEIFKEYNIELAGKNVVVIGRSILVGKPIALLCLKENASVSICHSKTPNLKDYTSKADILIVACGKPYLIDKSMVKDGSIIIDVGISRVDGHIKGDVNPDVDEKCAYRTPVPGGVGPMTVASLISNTLKAYLSQNEEK